MTMDIVEGEAVDWQVVSRKKGCGKPKPKSGHPPTDCLSQTECRKEELCTGSPSMRSIRSGASTKDTETAGDEPDMSLPGSPTLLSSWSETSTDFAPAGLDEPALTEESCSLQTSHSGSSLEVTVERDVCEELPEPLPSKASKPGRSKVKPQTKGAAVSAGLSHAIRRCTQNEEGTCSRRSGDIAHSAAPAGIDRSVPKRVACQEGKKSSGQQVVNSWGNNGNIVDSTGISDPVNAQASPDRKATCVAQHNIKTHPASRPAWEDLEPLGSTWVHNGRRDNDAEWNLIIFQPLWSCSSPDEPHVPVSIQAMDTGVRLLMRRTFLDLDPILDETPCRPRRAHSLDGRLRGKKL